MRTVKCTREQHTQKYNTWKYDFQKSNLKGIYKKCQSLHKGGNKLGLATGYIQSDLKMER